MRGWIRASGIAEAGARVNGERSSASMTTVAAPALAIPEVGAAAATHRPSLWAILRRKPLGAASGAIIVLLVLTAVFADVLAPYDPLETHPEIRLAAPSRVHLFGTDDIGRDVFSRVIHGSRISLWVGLLAVGIGTVAGMLIGLACGYWEGRLDLVAPAAHGRGPGHSRARPRPGHRVRADAEHHQCHDRHRHRDHSRQLANRPRRGALRQAEPLRGGRAGPGLSPPLHPRDATSCPT